MANQIENMPEEFPGELPQKTPKQELRRSLLSQRLNLSPSMWRAQSDRLCARLQADPIFAQAQTILIYSSFRQEPDLSPLFFCQDQPGQDQPSRPNQRWGLPRCVGKTLVWHHWAPGGRPLQAGAYGILEPHPDQPVLTPEVVDLILVPAVACDRQGYRLGYGGGFYDRLLNDSLWADKPTLGIVFDAFLMPQLPTDPWDQPLHGICTEVDLFWI